MITSCTGIVLMGFGAGMLVAIAAIALVMLAMKEPSKQVEAGGSDDG